MKSLFIFRRDLRLQDNTALIEAIKKSEVVYTCFIFNPEQLEKNEYKSLKSVNFMLNSLKELSQEIEKQGGKLIYFYGKPEEIIMNLDIEAIFVNKDYTPFGMGRDKKIESVCNEKNIKFFSFDDSLLTFPGEVLTDTNSPYNIFSHFFKKARQKSIKKPSYALLKNLGILKGKLSYFDPRKIESEKSLLEGGRSEAMNILKNLKNFKDYYTVKNFPSLEGTTKLSSHLRFGTISVRELYQEIKSQLGENHTLIQELFWRDFFYHVIFYHPSVLGQSFNKKYSHIVWENDKKKFMSWCEGKTGFPIVDAGMRELNATGWMHNRVRMIVASFLIKDLHIDWRWGEKYFAQKLVDYDVAINNGNWQWVASTGCDAQPYFRIFNPWLQQKKFDPECKYIKKWIPELKDFSPKQIHEWKGAENYLGPIIDHKTEAARTLGYYKLSF